MKGGEDIVFWICRRSKVFGTSLPFCPPPHSHRIITFLAEPCADSIIPAQLQRVRLSFYRDYCYPLPIFHFN
jgi:hypothetical protein